MGIPTYESFPPSGAQSPIESTAAAKIITNLGYWDQCTASEISRFLIVFQEEVESVHPIIDISEYVVRSQEILDAIRSGNAPEYTAPKGETPMRGLSRKDIDIVKVAVATGMVLEEHEKTDLSAAIIDSVEGTVSCMLYPEVDLKEIQLLCILVSGPISKQGHVTDMHRASTTSIATRS